MCREGHRRRTRQNQTSSILPMRWRLQPLLSPQQLSLSYTLTLLVGFTVHEQRSRLAPPVDTINLDASLGEPVISAVGPMTACAILRHHEGNDSSPVDAHNHRSFTVLTDLSQLGEYVRGDTTSTGYGVSLCKWFHAFPMSSPSNGLGRRCGKCPCRFPWDSSGNCVPIGFASPPWSLRRCGRGRLDGPHDGWSDRDYARACEE